MSEGVYQIDTVAVLFPNLAPTASQSHSKDINFEGQGLGFCCTQNRVFHEGGNCGGMAGRLPSGKNSALHEPG